MNGGESELVAEGGEDRFVVFTGWSVGVGKNKILIEVVVFELSVGSRDFESFRF